MATCTDPVLEELRNGFEGTTKQRNALEVSSNVSLDVRQQEEIGECLVGLFVKLQLVCLHA